MSESRESGHDFLSTETYEVLIVTTASVVNCVRYLISNAYHFVLTRVFNNDPLELFLVDCDRWQG